MTSLNRDALKITGWVFKVGLCFKDGVRYSVANRVNIWTLSLTWSMEIRKKKKKNISSFLRSFFVRSSFVLLFFFSSPTHSFCWYCTKMEMGIEGTTWREINGIVFEYCFLRLGWTYFYFVYAVCSFIAIATLSSLHVSLFCLLFLRVPERPHLKERPHTWKPWEHERERRRARDRRAAVHIHRER